MTRYYYGASHEQFPPDDALGATPSPPNAPGFDGLARLRPPPAAWWDPGESGGHALGVARRRRAGHPAPAARHGLSPRPGARYHPALDRAGRGRRFERLYPAAAVPRHRLRRGARRGPGRRRSHRDATTGSTRHRRGASDIIDRLWKGETITAGRAASSRCATARSTRSPTGARRVCVSPPSGRRRPRRPVAGATGSGRSPIPESTPELLDAYRDGRRAAGREGGGETVCRRCSPGRRVNDERAQSRRQQATGRAPRAGPLHRRLARAAEDVRARRAGDVRRGVRGQRRRGFRPGGDPGAAARARAARRRPCWCSRTTRPATSSAPSRCSAATVLPALRGARV